MVDGGFNDTLVEVEVVGPETLDWWVDGDWVLIGLGTSRIDEYALRSLNGKIAVVGVDSQPKVLGSTGYDLEGLFNVVSVIFMTPSQSCMCHDLTPRLNDSLVFVLAGIGMIAESAQSKDVDSATML